MPMRLPPREVQDRVAQELGEEFWPDFRNSLDRVKLNSPPVNVTEWYRSPAEAIAEKAKNPRAGLYTQHGFGLAQDLVARTAAEADLVERAALAEHFFVRRYASNRRLVHVAALTDEAWARSPLRREFERRVSTAQAAGRLRGAFSLVSDERR